MMYDLLIAVVAGLAGTLVMTSMMLYGKRLGLPAVDAHGILGFIQHADRASVLGYAVHGLLGIIFAIGYILVFRNVAGSILVLSAVLGLIHWLIVGWMFGLAPMVHAGMKAGTVAQTGPYMLKSLGIIGFLAGAVGHIVFGLVVGLIYAAFTGIVFM